MFKSKRLEERRNGLKLLNEIKMKSEKAFIIHYSCESFFNTHGRTPRVTSISVKNIKTTQVRSFSIHLHAQFLKKNFLNLSQEDYDLLERKMLDDFFKLIKQHKNYIWIHWNMRDSNYGFEAINNRYKILGGKITEIEDDLKYDLPNILGKIYTHNYEKNNPKGRLLNLAERNKLGTKNSLTGKEESECFDNKKYLELHISTLKKVDIINNLLEKVINESLIVNSKKTEIYGLTLAGVIEIVKHTYWLLILWSILIFIIGAACEPLIQDFFGTSK